MNDLLCGLGAPEPISTLDVDGHLADMHEWALAWLRAHNIEIEDHGDHIRLLLPAGATKSEQLPRIAGSRYHIRLPGGATFIYRTGGGLPRLAGVPQA